MALILIGGNGVAMSNLGGTRARSSGALGIAATCSGVGARAPSHRPDPWDRVASGPLQA